MASKLNKMDLEKYLNLESSTDSIADTSGSQHKERKRKRLTKDPTEPLPHEQACVTKSFVPLALISGIQGSAATAIAGNVPSSKVPLVSPTPTIMDVHFRPGIIDDGVRSSSEIDRMHSDKLRIEKLFEAARVNQLYALTLMKELKQDLISDNLDMDKLIQENEDLKRKLEVAHKAQDKLKKEVIEEARVNQLKALTLMKELKQDLISDDLKMDKLIKENENLKRKLEVAHKAQDKLKKEVFDLNNKQKKWSMEKIDLEYALKEERDLLKSTQINLSEQKKRLQQVMSEESHQYIEGFKCAKSQAAFLCSIDEKNLDAMRLWGQIKDGEIVVNDEGEESKDSDSQTDGSSKDSNSSGPQMTNKDDEIASVC